MTQERKPLIFISHAGENTWVARQIARCIEEAGAVPFLDEADVDIGAEFEDEILRSLERASELVVLMTPWARERPYVMAELGAAWLRKIPIVIVLHGLSLPEFHSWPGGMMFLKKRDVVKLNDIDFYFSQLTARASTDTKND